MPRQPLWDRPELRQVANRFAKEEIGRLLGEHGLDHLHVRSHGRHLVVCSEEPDGERTPHIRFTRIGYDLYELGVAHPQGRWAPTPFTGTIEELFTQARNELGWLLADY